MSEKKGIFGGLFGGKKSSGGCCNMEIVEESESGSCCCGSAPAKPEEPPCSCNGPVKTFEADSGDGSSTLSSVKVLGPGCKNCKALLESTQNALKAIGSSVTVEYVTDMATVAGYGVMSTPALVVNEKVVSMGKVLRTADVEKLLHKLGF